jgi:hypothetical protein
MSDREYSQGHQDFVWSDWATCAFDVVAREFVVVTADTTDLRSFAPLCSMLRRVRKAFGVEVAFICEGSDGETVVRRRGEDESDECHQLQALFGTRLLTDSAPDSCHHSYDSVAVVTNDGVEHGTLCCRQAGEGAEVDRKALHSIARLIANWFEEADLSLSGFSPLAGSTVMGNLSAAAY